MAQPPLAATTPAVTPATRPSLEAAQRIVVKVGSALLVDPASGARMAWLAGLAADLADLHRAGRDVLVVSSGAIALGRTRLGYPRGPLTLDRSQAAAAVGQIGLAGLWASALAEHGIVAGQVLITPQDTEERRRYLNARATLDELLARRAVPVINENDTVATQEIRYGDNDRLAARLGTMAGADVVVLLSDVDGLYTAPPARDPLAQHLPIVPRITAEIEAMAGGSASELSRGGMATKVEAAKIATAGGTALVIASGLRDRPLSYLRGGGRCTWFLTSSDPVRARKRWIGGMLDARGVLTVDPGAVAALRAGKSLLPAGVRTAEGLFQRGDVVVVRDTSGTEVARGLIAYDAHEAVKIAGAQSRDITRQLGYAGRGAMIHRDNLVLAADAPAAGDPA